MIAKRQICLSGFFFLAIAVTSSAVNADPQTDAVNERLPASMADREQHWGVDCAEVATRTRTLLISGDCPPAELTHQIRLCGFLYQPPGDLPVATCPNFAAAWSGLSTAADEDCASGTAQRESILRVLTCAGDLSLEE